MGGLHLRPHEIPRVEDVAGHSVLDQALEPFVVHAQRIGAEGIGVGLADQRVGVHAGGEAFRGRPLRGEGRPHHGGQGRPLQLQDRRNGGVAHQPEDGVQRLVDAVDAVGRPQARLHGAPVSVAHVLGDGDRPAVRRDRGSAVLHRHQVLVGLAADGIVLDLVEVRGLERYGVLVADVDDEGVVMQHRDVVFAAMRRVRDGGFARARQAEGRQDEFFSALHGIALESAVA